MSTTTISSNTTVSTEEEEKKHSMSTTTISSNPVSMEENVPILEEKKHTLMTLTDSDVVQSLIKPYDMFEVKDGENTNQFLRSFLKKFDIKPRDVFMIGDDFLKTRERLEFENCTNLNEILRTKTRIAGEDKIKEKLLDKKIATKKDIEKYRESSFPERFKFLERITKKFLVSYETLNHIHQALEDSKGAQVQDKDDTSINDRYLRTMKIVIDPEGNAFVQLSSELVNVYEQEGMDFKGINRLSRRYGLNRFLNVKLEVQQMRLSDKLAYSKHATLIHELKKEISVSENSDYTWMGGAIQQFLPPNEEEDKEILNDLHFITNSTKNYSIQSEKIMKNAVKMIEDEMKLNDKENETYGILFRNAENNMQVESNNDFSELTKGKTNIYCLLAKKILTETEREHIPNRWEKNIIIAEKRNGETYFTTTDMIKIMKNKKNPDTKDIRGENPLHATELKELLSVLRTSSFRGFETAEKIAYNDHLSVAGYRFSPLALSAGNSHKQKYIYFATEGTGLKKITQDEILRWSFEEDKELIGDKIKKALKVTIRMGLMFSHTVPTVEINGNQFKEIEDKTSKKYIMNDGCGWISEELAKQISNELKLEEYTPSAFQIRYKGYKGMVVIDKKLEGISMHLPKSMKKFNVPSTSTGHSVIEVVSTSQASTEVMMTPMLARILVGCDKSNKTKVRSNSQTENETEKKIQEIASKNLKQMLDEFKKKERKKMIEYCLKYGDKIGLNILGGGGAEMDAFMCGIYCNHIQKLEFPIPNSRLLFGVADPSGKLGENQVFIRISEDNGEKTLIGNLIVTREPCYHRGDLRIVECTDLVELEHLKDVIVFSTKGERPIPDMLSGGDLDGDKFICIWNEDLVKNIRQFEASTYSDQTEQTDPIRPKKPSPATRSYNRDAKFSIFNNAIEESMSQQNWEYLSLKDCTNLIEKFVENKGNKWTQELEELNILNEYFSRTVDAPKNKTWVSVEKLRDRTELLKMKYSKYNPDVHTCEMDFNLEGSIVSMIHSQMRKKMCQHSEFVGSKCDPKPSLSVKDWITYVKLAIQCGPQDKEESLFKIFDDLKEYGKKGCDFGYWIALYKVFAKILVTRNLKNINNAEKFLVIQTCKPLKQLNLSEKREIENLLNHNEVKRFLIVNELDEKYKDGKEEFEKTDFFSSFWVESKLIQRYYKFIYESCVIRPYPPIIREELGRELDTLEKKIKNLKEKDIRINDELMKIEKRLIHYFKDENSYEDGSFGKLKEKEVKLLHRFLFIWKNLSCAILENKLENSRQRCQKQKNPETGKTPKTNEETKEVPKTNEETKEVQRNQKVIVMAPSNKRIYALVLKVSEKVQNDFIEFLKNEFEKINERYKDHAIEDVEYFINPRKFYLTVTRIAIDNKETFKTITTAMENKKNSIPKKLKVSGIGILHDHYTHEVEGYQLKLDNKEEIKKFYDTITEGISTNNWKKSFAGDGITIARRFGELRSLYKERSFEIDVKKLRDINLKLLNELSTELEVENLDLVLTSLDAEEAKTINMDSFGNCCVDEMPRKEGSNPVFHSEKV